jgi:GDP-4-dehydro-6-deoxy-D-mannose reductase
VKVLVTGAEGFVGRRLVSRLVRDGHAVVASVRPGSDTGQFDQSVLVRPLELRDDSAVRGAAALKPDAVVHLAAIASGGDARRDPGQAWEVNAAGTARLAEALAPAGPRFLLVSTAEVYGAGSPVPRTEGDRVEPCTPYGASKLGAEAAAGEVWRRAGLPVLIARAFPHTGAGQDRRYVVPAFAARLLDARRASARSVAVGNLSPVREFMHVDDVVDAYVRLLRDGTPGEIYNVASGRGISLRELFSLLSDLVQYHPVPEVDESLVRASDIPYLVGSAAKISAETGWAPRISLEETLAEVVHAQER